MDITTAIRRANLERLRAYRTAINDLDSSRKILEKALEKDLSNQELKDVIQGIANDIQKLIQLREAGSLLKGEHLTLVHSTER